MVKSRLVLLLAFCVISPAHAGLFSDDQAREQIVKLTERVTVLEQQQAKSLLDMQTQIEALNAEIRRLRGQNEELAHGLANAEKREKDFYIDLDTRLRHFETKEEAAAPLPPTVPADPFDPSAENRAYEAAYALFRGGKQAESVGAFDEFIKKYPASVHAPNARYWKGDAQFVLKDYKAALETWQALLKAFPSAPRAADTLFNIAGCQQELKQTAESQKTLKQLIAKYPDSEAAAQAKKLLPAPVPAKKK